MVVSSRAVAVAGLVILMHAGSAAAQSPSASSGWGTNVESQADHAYRTIYERSFNSQPNGWTPSQIQGEPEPRRAVRAVRPARSARAVPDLPVRKPAELATAASLAARKPAPEATAASIGTTDPATVASTSPTPQPGVAAQPVNSALQAVSGDPWLEPIFARAGSRDDVLVTGVLGNEEPADRDRPRDRGDQYCSNIASAAADARFVWQKQALKETEEQVKKRIEDLQKQIAEYKKWLARRDDFSKKAQGTVTDIYAKMAPDAAAQQLMALDEETAAAVLTQLKPAVAGAVMAEMDAKVAARLTAIISASSKGPKGKPPVRPRDQQDRGT
jgi:flagellar motility protein MotE (MotC chaperone)